MKSLSKILTSVLLIFGASTLVKAASPPTVKQFINPKDWSFVENKGQLADENGKLLADVKYYSHEDDGVHLYFRQGAISFVVSKRVDANGETVAELPAPTSQNGLDRRMMLEKEFADKSISVVSSRADLVLLHANPNAEIAGTDQNNYYENYYLGYTPEAGVNYAHTYKTVTYKNIYPDIDMLIHAKPDGIKYEFIIYPGGNANDIQIQWDGLQSLTTLENGGLHYVNHLIDLIESKPESFLTTGSQVSSSFVKNGDIVSFSVPEYDHSQTLTIDPTIIWGSYFALGGRHYTQAVWTDYSGNVLICGPTTTTSGLATTGAFQTSYSTGSVSNAFLAKFSPAGALQWCTYYGGNNPSSAYNDGWSVSADNVNSIYLTGATQSTIGIATSGSNQSVYPGGSYDGYIAKFTTNGTRIWATYFGSTVNDQCLFLALDPSFNIYMTAWISSTTGIATAGAYQTAYGGGGFDAGLAKYDSTGKLLWSTYFGGTGTDYANGVATDINGNAIIIGQTASAAGIAYNGYQTTYGGGAFDGFVASFTPAGKLNWSTYQGGTGTDIGWGAVCDQSGYVYCVGQTSSTAGIAAQIPYQSKLYGTSNTYLSKFSPTGNIIWSTYYGGSGGVDTGNNVAVDPTGSVFITGGTSSISGIASAGAYQNTLSGNYDAYLAKFSPAGSLMYGTYYGGTGYTNGFDVHTDAVGNTYFSGRTNSSTGIATSGGYSTSGGGGLGVFLADFNFKNLLNDAGIALLTSPTALMCVSSTPVKVMLENFGTNDLSKVNIGWSINGKLQTPYSWTGTLKKNNLAPVSLGPISFPAGIDTIKVWTYQPNGVLDSIPTNDTLMTTDTILAQPKAITGKTGSICMGSPYSIGTPNSIKGHKYIWNSYPGSFTSTSSNPTVNPTTTTTYYLVETVSALGCISASDSVVVNAVPIPSPTAGGNHVVCYGGATTLGTSPLPTHKYFWSSVPPGFSSTLAQPVTGGLLTTTTFYETDIDTTAGCYGYGSAIITVSPAAKATSGGDHAICTGNSIGLGGSATSGHTYKWTSVPTGFTSTVSNPTTIPKVNTKYRVAETITATGCIELDSANISLNPLPTPNAGLDQTICNGGTVVLTGKTSGTDPYTWTSNPVGFTSTATKITVSPNLTTSYYLSETIKATGCSNIDTAIVTVNQPPAPYPGVNSSICKGSSAAIGGSPTLGHTYQWSSRPSGFSSKISLESVTPKATTTYILTETITATGCSKSDSAIITVITVTPHAGGSHKICAGSSITLGATAVNGDTYAWVSKPAGFTSTASNPVAIPKNNTLYYVTETIGTSGCSATDSAVITLNPAPDATVWSGSGSASEQKICLGNSIGLGDAAVGSNAYSWKSNPKGFSSSQSDPTVSPTVTTVYSLTETMAVTSCTKTDSIKITVNPLPSALWSATFSGKTTTFHANDSLLPRADYQWDFGNPTSGGADTASGHSVSHIFPKNTSYSVSLVVTDANGCTKQIDSNLNVTVSGILQQLENKLLGLNIYPNPFEASTVVEYNLAKSTNVKIELFDVSGKQIGTIATGIQAAGKYQVGISAEKYNLTPGIYLLKIIMDDGYVSRHIVKM